MIHPYLIPSHPDAKDFVAALEQYANDGSLIQFERLSGMETYTFSGSVVSVIPGEDRVLVRREGREPESYWIRYFFRIADCEGKTTENKAALAKHREAQDRRDTRAADGQRALVDHSFIPNTHYETSAFASKVAGSIHGRACEFFAFKSKNDKPVLSVVYARDEAAATRGMLLLDAEVSTWDVFASYLQAHFLWPAWLNLREQARAHAAKLRAGASVLLPEADGWQRTDREAFYKDHGLTWEDWGATASLYSLEGAELDFEALFAFADRVPVSLLNLYLIVAFDSVQFFDQIERVDADLLRQFIRHGLAVAQPLPTGTEAIDTMAIAKLRELVKIAGTGFKARSASEIRDHLKTCWSPMLECEAVRRAHFKRYQLLPPPGWDWDQFQFFRADYRNMLDALHQWMFNGRVPPKAAERFTAIM
jgi:hypothetical protein